MSYVPGDKSVDPQLHFIAGMKDLLRFDKVRLVNILGSVQYGIAYTLAFFIVGIGINFIFPPFTTTYNSLYVLFFSILLQSLVIIIVTFYIQKLIQAMPGVVSFFPEYFDYNKMIFCSVKKYKDNKILLHFYKQVM
jgi:predicted neutral ceramidase superfamily lipid hydrolase